MAWKIEFQPSAFKELSRLGKKNQKRILKYVRERVAKSKEPKKLAKHLKGDKVGLCRFRVGDYRLICHIEKKGANGSCP